MYLGSDKPKNETRTASGLFADRQSRLADSIFERRLPGWLSCLLNHTHDGDRVYLA